MKKNIIFLFFTLAVLFTSCKKENTDETNYVTLNVTINAGENYKLALGQYGDADDVATITTQANSFITSEIVKTGVIGEYNFAKAGLPKVGGNGFETVVIKITEGENYGFCGTPNANGGSREGKKGKGHHDDETIVTINFTVL